MTNVASLVEEVRRCGFELRCKGPDLQLIGRGHLEDELRHRLREHKSDVMLYLRHGAEWGPLRELGARLGETVLVDGRKVVLWGVTPRGPIVDTGPFVITVDTDAVELPSQGDQ